MAIRYYIDLFQKENTTHQRQLVKITSAILNAFHFQLAEEDNLEAKEQELRKKIRGTLRFNLLPRLCGTLAGKLRGPTAVADEDELILRVPLAVPIVRLLQLDSTEAVERHIPGIIAKLASFLKSKVRYRAPFLGRGIVTVPPLGTQYRVHKDCVFMRFSDSLYLTNVRFKLQNSVDC